MHRDRANIEEVGVGSSQNLHLCQSIYYTQSLLNLYFAVEIKVKKLTFQRSDIRINRLLRTQG